MSEIQTTFISFGELKPDSGEFMNSALVEAVGVYPMGDVYIPIQPIYARSEEIGSGADPTIVRGHVNQSPETVDPTNVDRNFHGGNVYVAVDGCIYTAQESADPWVVTKMAGGLTIDSDSGNFCGFGPIELFACGHSSLMQSRTTGGVGFADCITTPGIGDAPYPKYVCVIGERVLIANLANCTNTIGTPDVNPNAVWWSATRDPAVFGTSASHPADRTGFNLLYDDFGGIMGLAGNKEYALIFKRRAIVRMDFGEPYGFTFRWIPQSVGTISHLSICSLGRDTYFWGDPGPCVYRDDQVIPLAYGKIALTLLETKLGGPNGLASITGSGVDPVNQLVWWTYTYLGVGGYRFAKLVYCPVTDRFSFAMDALLAPTTAVWDSAGAITPAQIVSSWGGLNKTGMPIVSGVYAVQNYEGNTLKLYTFNAESGDRWWDLDLKLSTGYFALSLRGGSVVQRIRPIVRTKAGTTVPDLQVTVNVKNKPWEDPTAYGPFKLSTHGDSRGFITCPGVGASQLVQLVLEAPSVGPIQLVPYSTIREIEGLQVEFSVRGDKGT